MNKPYDLIIIGNSHQSFATAEYATSLSARVGIIPLFTKNNISPFLNLYKSYYLSKTNLITYQDFLKKKQQFISLQTIPQLIKQGVHFINSSFRFNQKRKLYLITPKDVLIASNYLLTGEENSPNLSSINEPSVNCITLDRLIIENKWNSLPNYVAIWGNDITAIYLAIRLINIQKQVSLFSENNCLLPCEDEDISWFLQLYLEAKGVKLYYQQNFNKECFLDYKKKEIKLIITDIYENKTNNHLALTDLGVKFDLHGIKVNSRLQTNHPQIYACGNILGGYPLENIAKYEGKIAVKNALFFSWQKIEYSKIPYFLTTQPPIYRLGYTEKQARLYFDDHIKVINLFPSQDNFLFDHDSNIYYLKIIIDRHNYIIGFHSLGLAEEIFTAIKIMVKSKQPLTCLFKFNFVDEYTIQLIKEIKKQWQEENSNRNDMIRGLRETFLIWKNNLV